MNLRRLIFSTAFALALACFPQFSSAQSLQQTVVCSSSNGQRNYCAVNNSGVRINRRLSEASCDQNSSWGYDNSGIWVDRGCSAEFMVDTYSNGNTNNGGNNNQGTYNNGGYNNQGTSNNGSYNNAQTIRCTARNRGNDRTYCQADTSGGVQLVNQVSGNCQQDSTWGYDSNGIWVSRGCSADFQLGGYNNSGYGSRYGYGRRRNRKAANSYSLRCDSSNGDENYCPADARGGVHLLREYSSNVCRQGSTWGYDSGGVWVSNGCSAEFEVDGYGNTSGYYSGRTTTIPSGTEVQIRSDEVIDSKTAYAGQRYAADVAQDVKDSNGQVIIPRGSQAELILHDANYNNNSNNNNSNQNLVIDLDSVTVNGQRYIVSTKDITTTSGGIGANKKTGEYVGGGALLGAIIGAVAGGGKGAAIGAAVGGAAGAGGVVLTKGKDIKVPVETVLKFKLDQDLTLQAVR